MPNIAQQDYLYIEIVDASSLTNGEKAELAKVVENKTLFDTIFILDNGNVKAKALSIDIDASEVYVIVSGVIETLAFGE